MVGALIFVGLVIGVLVLYSRVKELKYQLGQEQRERAMYEGLYDRFMVDLYGSTLPGNFREASERQEQ